MDVAEFFSNRLVSTLVPVIISVLAATIFILNKKKLTSSCKSLDKPVRSSSEKIKKATLVTLSSAARTENKNSAKVSPAKKDAITTKSKTAAVVVVATKQEKKKANGKPAEKLTAKPTNTTKKVVTNQGKSLRVQNLKQSKTIKAKPLENDEFGGDIGEWQTVLTKKQKKQQTPDPLIQAVAEVAAATKGAKVKVQKKKEKSSGKEKSSKNHTTSTAAYEKLQELTAIQDEKVVNAFVSTPTTIEEQSIPQLNLTPTDDDDWTETKPLKKTKRRALRE